MKISKKVISTYSNILTYADNEAISQVGDRNRIEVATEFDEQRIDDLKYTYTHRVPLVRLLGADRTRDRNDRVLMSESILGIARSSSKSPSGGLGAS